MPNDAAIAVVQWGDPNVEDDDIAAIRNHLAIIPEDRRPELAVLPVTTDSPAVLITQMSDFVALLTNAQVLYFAAHGGLNNLAFSQTGPSITYQQLGDLLRDNLHVDCEHLVLGSCQALNPVVDIGQYMPDQVEWVSGFTSRPSPTQVTGLLFSIIMDDVTLFSLLSAGNKVKQYCWLCRLFRRFARVFGGGIDRPPSVNTKDLMQKWIDVLKTYRPNPVAGVGLGSGRAGVVRRISRSPQDRTKWLEEEFPLRNS